MRLPVRSIDFVQHKGRRGGYRYKLHSHGCQELMYVDYGKMILTLHDKDRVLSAGDCLFVRGGSRHGVRSDGDRPFSFLNIAYRGDPPRGLAEETLHLSPMERRLILEIKREGEEDRYRKKAALLLRLNLLLLQMERRRREHAEGTPAGGENRERYRHATVDRAIGLLECTFSRPLDTEELARQIGVSPSHLRRLVRRETGMSLSRHLQRIRIESAKQMLLWSADNIDMIAFRVGYGSAAHFSTLFKKAMRMTPSEYARSLGAPGGAPRPARRQPEP